MSDLTILCVTQYEPHAHVFLDEMSDLAADLGGEFVEWDGRDAGCIENILNSAVAGCPEGYILRLDDDERCTTEMRDWLFIREYRAHNHWAFPRMNLWPDERSFIQRAHWEAAGKRWWCDLYPDLQTRLSVKAKSGGRGRVHEGSPFGTGQVAQVAIEHHKFLVKSETERRALVDRYEQLQPGAGSAFVPFSVPEDVSEIEITARSEVIAA